MITTQSQPVAAPVSILALAAKTPVEQIADRIEEMNRIDEGVSKDDLLPFFSKALIDRYGQEAADLVRSRSVRALD